MLQSYGYFLFFPNFASAIQANCLIATSFPGCFRQRSATEIKPVEPGQGNACEGKDIVEFPLLHRVASCFLTLKSKKNEEDFFCAPFVVCGSTELDTAIDKKRFHALESHSCKTGLQQQG
jgi:hypothetical protein